MSVPQRLLLCELADAYGVGTQYWSANGTLEIVEDETLIKVLAAMDVDARSEESAYAALEEAHLAPWRDILPACTVAREGCVSYLHLHVPHGAGLEVGIEFEEGGFLALEQGEDFTEPRLIDGMLTGQATFLIPGDLPWGYHTLVASVDPSSAYDECAPQEPSTHRAALIYAPARIELPSVQNKRGWGVMAQLYSVRSHTSWGVGDASDLAELCAIFGEMGGDFVLVNPLHAAELTGHMTPSPYLPVTRRFFNPIYIRVEDIDEYAYLRPGQRAKIDALAAGSRALSEVNGIIDRDTSWANKREALRVIFTAPRSHSRQRAFERFTAEQGKGLEDFALWCAVREAGEGNFPEGFDSPDSPAAKEARTVYAQSIEFYSWLQWILDNQLARAQRVARESGMSIGIFHDLAVGVHPVGSDTWATPDVFAQAVTVGAPPDVYNPLGQNWSQPPWRPDALARQAYAPMRDLVRTVMRHAGGIRVDHIMGLFRLWWIPEGNAPSQGAYVRFDHEALVSVLVLEACRAGALVVGEDLGTVEPWVRDFLADRGILGTSVLWFEQDETGHFLSPEHIRSTTLATVDTHDLPPLAGYLDGEHVRIRESLNLLVDPPARVWKEAQEERARMVSTLEGAGLLNAQSPRARLDPRGEAIDDLQDEAAKAEAAFHAAASASYSEEAIIEAMHCYIARTPAELIAISLVDCVGEKRAQNQPGTNNEYPNWRVPLADETNELVFVEDLPTNERLHSLIRGFTAELISQR